VVPVLEELMLRFLLGASLVGVMLNTYTGSMNPNAELIYFNNSEKLMDVGTVNSLKGCLILELRKVIHLLSYRQTEQSLRCFRYDPLT
jgi:hypothetical protein